MFSHAFHDEWFHYSLKPGNFFEGWYYRITDKTGQHAFVFILGVSGFRQDAHSFVQMLDGKNKTATYFRFPFERFVTGKPEFFADIAGNRFSLNNMELDLRDTGVSVQGKIRLGTISPWQGTRFHPKAMGWFGFFSFLECYHGVMSFYHELEGSLTINNRTIDFTGGRGYIEKDWGRSFPSSWVWAQSSHFPEEGTSFMLAVAEVPFLFARLRGFIIALYHQGKLYRFANYTGARIKHLSVEDDRLRLVIRDKHYVLTVNAVGLTREIESLRFPLLQEGMQGLLKENLSASISLELKERKTGASIYRGEGKLAGMEVGGDIRRIMKK